MTVRIGWCAALLVLLLSILIFVAIRFVDDHHSDPEVDYDAVSNMEIPNLLQVGVAMSDTDAY